MSTGVIKLGLVAVLVGQCIQFKVIMDLLLSYFDTS